MIYQFFGMLKTHHKEHLLQQCLMVVTIAGLGAHKRKLQLIDGGNDFAMR
jgi:hypothetical protein